MFLTRWLRTRSANSPTPRHRFRPRVEPMEDRSLPSGGVLDPTFGTAGLSTNLIGLDSRAYAVTTYPAAGTANDGKIVAAGSAIIAQGSKNGTANLAVARYNLDGSLDATFGGTGAVAAVPGTAVAVLVQPDGKVVAAGRSGNDFIVVRYNTNGTPDASFGSNGQVITDINRRSDDSGDAMILQSDGKIIVAGRTSPRNTVGADLALVRYNANGILDTSFGTGGKLITRFTVSLAGTANRRVNLALDPSSGKLVVGAQLAGTAVVAQVNSNGTLDSTFGPATGHPGYVYLGSLYGPAVAVQTDGRIVVTGDDLGFTSSGDIALVRLNRDGTPDTSFDLDGIVVTTPVSGTDNYPRSVKVQADGNIMVGGYQIDHVTGGSTFLVARYSPAGSLDTTFGVNGVATGGANGAGHEGAMALEPDGRIVVAGFKSGVGPTVFSLARFLATGPQIGSFAASPNPVTAGDPLTLTAGGVTALNPGSTVTRVAFYQDSDGNGVLDRDADLLLGYATQNGAGTWAFTFSIAELPPGAYTFFAAPKDSYGALGDPLALTVVVA